MIRFASMLWFHLRIFARNSYFIQLLVTSTLSVLILQVLAGLTSHTPADPHAWLRAGMVGMWGECTVAAGLLGFQRFQGTLVNLVLSPLSLGKVLLPLIASAASFGLLAFPLAALAAWILRVPVGSISSVTLVLGVVVLWVGCLAVSAAVAALFVLTPNAMTYEGLLMVPLVLLSGVFALPAALEHVLLPIKYLIPTSGAVTALLDGGGGPGPTGAAWLNLLASPVASAAWFALAHVLSAVAARRAIAEGTLELV